MSLDSDGPKPVNQIHNKLTRSILRIPKLFSNPNPFWHKVPFDPSFWLSDTIFHLDYTLGTSYVSSMYFEDLAFRRRNYGGLVSYQIIQSCKQT